MKNNIALIGMAGVGKSHVSRLLSSVLGYTHIETDAIITSLATRDGVDKDLLSDEAFMAYEEKALLSLSSVEHAVIDTGGSVIYSPAIMQCLKKIAFIVYLSDSTERIEARFLARGLPHVIGLQPSMSFRELLASRLPLYEKYADLMIDRTIVGERGLPELIANSYRES